MAHLYSNLARSTLRPYRAAGGMILKPIPRTLPSARTLPSLAAGSTSRVLNLLALTSAHPPDPESGINPIFSAPILNNTIIAKHRLRPDEADLMRERRRFGTKLIFPFDKLDLRTGGRSLLVGQKGYEEALREVGNYGDRYDFEHDMKVLGLLDQLSSLDPFLLREHLRANGFHPDPQYFDISDFDQKRMFNFAMTEIRRLTELAAGPGEQSGNEAATRMVRALLSATVDDKLEPLRLTLDLSPEQFRDAISTWRGFIYYKWSLMDFRPDLLKTLERIKAVVPPGHLSINQRAQLAGAKKRMLAAASKAGQDINNMITIYDAAYEKLILESNPRKFREFLLRGPLLFPDLGGKMGALMLATSFWKNRFPEGARPTVDCEEMTAILKDFTSLIGELGGKFIILEA
jgi:hypothetical protein